MRISRSLLLLALACSLLSFACDDSADWTELDQNCQASFEDSGACPDGCLGLVGRPIDAARDCSGPLQVVACVHENYRSIDGAACTRDPHNTCICDIGSIPPSWQWVETADCSVEVASTIPERQQCGDGTCQLNSQADCNVPQCLWTQGNRLDSDQQCLAPQGACSPALDKPSISEITVALGSGDACWLYPSTDVPSGFINCTRDAADNPQACQACLEFAQQADTDNWPECE